MRQENRSRFSSAAPKLQLVTDEYVHQVTVEAERQRLLRCSPHMVLIDAKESLELAVEVVAAHAQDDESGYSLEGVEPYERGVLEVADKLKILSQSKCAPEPYKGNLRLMALVRSQSLVEYVAEQTTNRIEDGWPPAELLKHVQDIRRAATRLESRLKRQVVARAS